MNAVSRSRCIRRAALLAFAVMLLAVTYVPVEAEGCLPAPNIHGAWVDWPYPYVSVSWDSVDGAYDYTAHVISDSYYDRIITGGTSIYTFAYPCETVRIKVKGNGSCGAGDYAEVEVYVDNPTCR
jgi:hypothetical protein